MIRRCAARLSWSSRSSSAVNVARSTNAAKQVIEHRLVELESTPRRTLAKQVSSRPFIERLEREPGALLQPRDQVRQHERQCRGHRRGGINEPRRGLPGGVVKMEQGQFVLAIAGNGLQSIQANQSGSSVSDQGLAQTASQCRRGQEHRRLGARTRPGTGRELQVGLATAGRSGKIKPLLPIAIRHRLDQGTKRVLPFECSELLIRWKPEAQRDLRTHTSGRGVGSDAARGSNSGVSNIAESGSSATASAPYKPLRVYRSCT